MPIDVSPPMSGNLQGFQIASPQSTDPLQTLAQMSQLRTQGLQQQQAQLGITQAQQKMDSNRAIMQSLIDGDGNWDKTDAAMRTHPEILPEDYAMVREHAIKALTDRQALDKGQLDIQDREHKNWASLFEGAKTQDDVNNVVAAGLQQGYKPPPNFVDEQGNLLHNFVGPDAADQIAAYRATLLLPQDLSEEKLKTQQTLTSKAEAAKAAADTAKTGLETDALTRQQAVSDIRMAPQDPNTGTPTPGAWQAILANPRYKGLNLPAQPTKSYIDNLEESTIPEKDVPEFRIKLAEANALKSMTDQNWQDYIGRVVEDHSTPLYRRTMQLVDFYRSQGNLKAADDAVKAAGEQLGKTESAVATAKATAPIKIYTSAAEATAKADAAGLTDDDYARAGEQYMRTGVMPALGRDSVTRGKVVKAGNQWARDNGLSPSDVVTMQAAYAGDKESLKKFQAQRDQIVSFEQTAQKNLDLFLNAAAKIPDTGVPWLNKPLRELNQGLVGSENMAVVNAARQVANNEIAKVTSGGGLSGVLSDSARHEVESYNPANATFAQTKAVAQVLKQDMANRHGSMDATLSDIKARIGGGGTTGGQQGGGQQGGTPPVPASIPPGAEVHYSPSRNVFQYSTDPLPTYLPDGRTPNPKKKWTTVPAK